MCAQVGGSGRMRAGPGQGVADRRPPPGTPGISSGLQVRSLLFRSLLPITSSDQQHLGVYTWDVRLPVHVQLSMPSYWYSCAAQARAVWLCLDTDRNSCFCLGLSSHLMIPSGERARARSHVPALQVRGEARHTMVTGSTLRLVHQGCA